MIEDYTVQEAFDDLIRRHQDKITLDTARRLAAELDIWFEPSYYSEDSPQEA